MKAPSSTRFAVPALDAVLQGEQLEMRGQLMKIRGVLDWAEAHPPTSIEPAALGDDTALALAGEGAPLVSEFAVMELAAALRIPQGVCRTLVGDALELKYRLPRLWARVSELAVPVWQARRIVAQTSHLTLGAATWVDAQVAPFAHKMRPADIERLIDLAIDRFMPETADERRESAAESRHVTIDTRGQAFDGTAQIHAEVDLPDALDFEHAIAAGAQQRKDLGSTEALNVRRAQALGDMARTQLALDLTDPAPGRAATLYLHLDPATGRGWTENGGRHEVTADTIRDWLQTPGTRVTVRPVLDLAEQIATDSYTPTPLQREQVFLISPTCLFPGCRRRSRKGDVDHIIAFDTGGKTISINLGHLCRPHHRLKTHGGWTYQAIDTGVVQWVSPLGRVYLVDRHGTLDITPASSLGQAAGDPPYE